MAQETKRVEDNGMGLLALGLALIIVAYAIKQFSYLIAVCCAVVGLGCLTSMIIKGITQIFK